MNAIIHEHDPTVAEFGQGRRLKTTTSLCPSCLETIDAEVFARNDEVWMDKRCPRHGPFSARLSGDPRHYYRADPRVSSLGSCCGSGRHCGDQMANHSCNVLIEVTQRCNLRCPACYADSAPERDAMMSLARFEEVLDGLLAQGKGDTDLIQLSGGEPTIHPQIFEMIELALAKGIRRVYLNTNGIKLSQRRFAERLAGFGSQISVYLQLDSLRAAPMLAIRGRDDLVEIKLRALDLCEEYAIDTAPVMTLSPGVNEDQLGPLLEAALARPRAVHKLMIQPAIYSGRYELPRRVERLGVAEVARLLCEQTDGLFSEDDFGPIPCSDPNCFSMALALRSPEGLLPVSRYFPRYARWADEGVREVIGGVSDTFDSAADLRSIMQWAVSSGALETLDDQALDSLLETIAASLRASETKEWRGLFAIGIKPFMDAYTYDQDRIDKCCVHIIATDGSPVSFCEYNARHRPLGIG